MAVSRSFLLISALSALCIGLVRASGWSYNGVDDGPDEWHVHYPLCGGTSQSPIDIVTSSATYSAGLAFNYINYNEANTGAFTVTNNGHSVVVKMPAGAGIALSGGQLPNTFVLDHFHMHWGSANNQGSEHSLNGQHYALEFHLVHYNSKYGSVSEAANQTDGLAVCGVLVSVDSAATEITEVNDLVSILSSVSHEDDTATMTSFAIDAILPDNHKIYRYQGSLTTPTCDETVTWSVFAHPIKFTPQQIEAVRSLFFNVEGEPDVQMVNNYRPTQDLNGRQVLKSHF